MRPIPTVRRVVLVVLDGLRPDAIQQFDLANIRRLARLGAFTDSATTVAPSVTAAAMTSLLTGVAPQTHGVSSDRFHIPRSAGKLSPIPCVLERAGCPSSAFMARIPFPFRGLASRMSRRLGMGDVRFTGDGAPEILFAAHRTLAVQRRGLILFHWPDADRAGHEHGWMSERYAEAARRLDASVGLLAGLANVPHDPSTLLIALADHGGGGAKRDDHDSDHPLDRTIPLLLVGGAVAPGALPDTATLLDVPATVLWALGIEPPRDHIGRALIEAFAAPDEIPAVA